MPTAPARQTQKSFAGSFGSFAGSFWSFVGSLRSFDRFLSPLLGPSVLRWVVDSFVGSLSHSTGPSVLRHVFRHVLRRVLQSFVGSFGGFVRSFGGILCSILHQVFQAEVYMQETKGRSQRRPLPREVILIAWTAVWCES
jgi:hypothetical protein